MCSMSYNCNIPFKLWKPKDKPKVSSLTTAPTWHRLQFFHQRCTRITENSSNNACCVLLWCFSLPKEAFSGLKDLKDHCLLRAAELKNMFSYFSRSAVCCMCEPVCSASCLPAEELHALLSAGDMKGFGARQLRMSGHIKSQPPPTSYIICALCYFLTAMYC